MYLLWILVYQNTVAGEITRFEGSIARYMGDGVLTYFGWPRAHEDDAERAVRAGLAVNAAVAKLNAPGGAALAARTGIATGLVVVGDLIGEGTSQEEAVVGETPNLAARLQSLATPNSVVIASATQQLLLDAFDYRDLGTHSLKGFTEPVQAWQVLGTKAIESRFEARHKQWISLTGRDGELALLLDRWQQAKSGEGQVVLLSGEAGIGKSRISQELNEQIRADDYIRVRYQCSPYHTNSALYPIITQLEQAAQFDAVDSTDVKLDKLKTLLTQSTLSADTAVPLLAALLSIPIDGHYPPLNLTPQAQKEKTLQVLVELLLNLASKQPLLFILEDAHWIDPTTQELLDSLIEQIQEAPVLMLVTCRPEFTPPWSGHTYYTALVLNRLSRRSTSAIVEELTGGKALPDEVLQQIIDKTDGIPLFVEELTKTVLKAGILTEEADRHVLSAPLPPLAIPSTLQDSLVSRLDQIAPAKSVAQIGAVIGREFSYELLAAVSTLAEDALNEALDQLTQAGLVFQRGTPPDATYLFKHALAQDAAYQGLLKSQQQQLHARIAQTLQDRYPNVAEHEPELLAYHFTHAHNFEESVNYWEAAGKRAISRSATSEAINHLRAGLNSLEKLPENDQRDRRELNLQIALGSVLLAAKGYAASETGQTYQRARELCVRFGIDRETLSPLFGLFLFHFIRGEIDLAEEVTDEILAFGEYHQDMIAQLMGLRAIASNFFFRGHLDQSRTKFAELLRHYYSAKDRPLYLSMGYDLGMIGHGFSSVLMGLLGFPEQAIIHGQKAIAIVETDKHANSIANAYHFSCITNKLFQKKTETMLAAEKMLTLSSGQGFVMWSALAYIYRGWVLAQTGKTEQGISELNHGINAYKKAGSVFSLPYFQSMLAEAMIKADHLETAQALIENTLKSAETRGERWYVAELHRIKGKLLLTRSHSSSIEIERCFDQALDIARRQQAKLLELRAATSLAKLWRDQDKSQQAVELLTPIYDWFTEGFDTADLKYAKTLLDELS